MLDTTYLSNNLTIAANLPNTQQSEFLIACATGLPHYDFEESMFSKHTPVFDEKVDWGGKIEELLDKYDEAWHLLSNR